MAEKTKILADVLEKLSQLAYSAVGISQVADPGAEHLMPRLGKPTILYSSEVIHPAPYEASELNKLLQNDIENSISIAKTVSPEMFKTSTDYIIAVLSSLGHATLKSTWKAYYAASPHTRTRSLTFPAPHMHTWSLGLPRGNYKGHERGWTGYVLACVDVLRGCCKNFEHAPYMISGSRQDKIPMEISKVIMQPRFKSPLILAPVPGGILAIAPGRAGGIIKRLATEEIQLDGNRYKLVHVGVHRHKPRGVRRLPVGQIIKYSRIPRSCEPKRLCPDTSKHRPAGDPGGVSTPPQTGTKAESHENQPEQSVWEATLLWIKFLLHLEEASK